MRGRRGRSAAAPGRRGRAGPRSRCRCRRWRAHRGRASPPRPRRGPGRRRPRWRAWAAGRRRSASCRRASRPSVPRLRRLGAGAVAADRKLREPVRERRRDPRLDQDAVRALGALEVARDLVQLGEPRRPPRTGTQQLDLAQGAPRTPSRSARAARSMPLARRARRRRSRRGTPTSSSRRRSSSSRSSLLNTSSRGRSPAPISSRTESTAAIAAARAWPAPSRRPRGAIRSASRVSSSVALKASTS